MRHLRPLLAASLLLACHAPHRAPADPRATVARPVPPTATVDVVDVHHGVEVADPYRWLEDAEAPETAAWVAAQNEVTFDYLAQIPERAELVERLTALWDYERTSAPVLRGRRMFFTHNDGLANQARLFVADSFFDEPRLLLDPNVFSEDGTIALANWVPNDDGSLLAYATSDGGSDWRTWRFLDVATGEHLTDEIRRNKFGRLQWCTGGVVYQRYVRPTDEAAELTEKNRPAEICLHALGTDEEDDRVLVPAPPEGYRVGVTATLEGTALLIWTTEVATRHDEVRLFSLAEGHFGTELELVSGFGAQYSYVGHAGDTVFLRTDAYAPNWKVVSFDPDLPQGERFREIVPEAAEAIRSASVVGGRVVVNYMRDAVSDVRTFALDGSDPRRVDLPGLGTASGFRGEVDDEFTFFSYASYTTPAEVWRLHVQSGELTPWRKPEVGFDPADFVARQVFYESADGTRVPMFVVHRRGLELDGENPTLLYGYGGFDVSLTPRFSVTNVAWMERGGVYAVPNLRGGGEYGEAWHAAGTKTNKQNVFDDFLAAAEWLVAAGYTRPEKLAISGGSNGGLLVGACMTQRPELFGACLPAVGVMDMLRYHLFTIGWSWAGDYGTVDDPDEFRALLAYSPYHRLEEGVSYPATLVTTAARDDRVVPAHSFKFAARLQACHAGDAPVLIRVETRAGHGAGKPTAMRIEEAADRLAFLCENLR